MDGNGAEVAFAVAAAMGGDRKADGLQRFDRTLGFIIWMLGALEIEGIDRIQLGLGLVGGGRVLDQVAVAVLLAKPAPADGIVVPVKGVEHIDESQLVLRSTVFEGRQLKIIPGVFLWRYSTGREFDAGRCRRAGGGEFQGGIFSHAVQDVVGLGVEQDRTLRTALSQKS